MDRGRPKAPHAANEGHAETAFSGALDAVVAIPARDEANRIALCLEAFARQTVLRGTARRSCGPLASATPAPFGVLLLLNNCRDGTAAVAARLKPLLPFELAIEECELPPELSHAGGARRLAMDSAADWLRRRGSPDGFLLTTDADTVVAADWIACQHAAFAAGADAVAGLVLDHPEESRRLPKKLRRRGAFEAKYMWLLTELESRLDPDPDDPWPRHPMAAGASLAVRRSWYARVGGLPVQPAGEDRALVARLGAAGARIRHCVRTRVVTSCRLDGRAPGGMADTMRQRIAEPDAFCDPTLEPVSIAVERYRWRAALRRRFRAGLLGEARSWAAHLAIAPAAAEMIAGLGDFPAVWEAVEAHSPYLRPAALRPAALPAQIILAKQVLRSLRGGEADNGDGQPAEARVSLLLRHRAGRAGGEPWRATANIPA